MFQTLPGDLASAEADAVVIPVNTVGLLSRGAGQRMQTLYPDMSATYRAACRAGVRPGDLIVHAVPGRYQVVCMPIKEHYRDPADEGYLRAGLEALAVRIRTEGFRTIAFPRFRAGLGKLRWAELEAALVAQLGTIPDLTVYLFDE